MSRPLKERHVDILARDVLDRGIGRFAERQGFSRVGDDPARDRDHDPDAIASNTSPLIKLFLSRVDDMIACVSKNSIERNARSRGKEY